MDGNLPEELRAAGSIVPEPSIMVGPPIPFIDLQAGTGGVAEYMTLRMDTSVATEAICQAGVESRRPANSWARNAPAAVGVFLWVRTTWASWFLANVGQRAQRGCMQVMGRVE